MNWIYSALAGLAAGILSGFGIGGGTLLLLWLTLWGGMDQLHAGSVNLLYFVCCALPALWGHTKHGMLEKRAVLWCALTGVPACIAGSLLAVWLDVTLLRRLFGGFLLLIGFRELFSKKTENKKGTQRK